MDEDENAFWLRATRWIVIGIAVIIIATTVFGVQYCNAHDQRVVDCVQTGRSPAECKEGMK
jgi:hypothetical protein